MEEKEREGEKKKHNFMENFGLNYITYCIYVKIPSPPLAQNFKKI